jgi:hypothetical protein
MAEGAAYEQLADEEQPAGDEDAGGEEERGQRQAVDDARQQVHEERQGVTAAILAHRNLI